MKKGFLLAVILITKVVLLPAQAYKLPAAELTDEFKSIFVKTNQSDNFFNRLTSASDQFFFPTNKSLCAAVSGLGKDNSWDIESRVKLIFDTVLHSFIQTHAWDEYPEKLSDDRELYGYINSKTCPCVSAKIEKNGPDGLTEEDVRDCIAALVTDTAYINTMRRLAGSKTMNEIYAISQFSMIYSFQHCSGICNYFLDIIKMNSVFEYMNRLKISYKKADQIILVLYHEKAFDELSSFFPAYKKFETQIKQLDICLNSGERLLNFLENVSLSGVTTFTKTYYKYKNDTPVIVGQVTYDINENVPTESVLSLKFYSADKISDKAAILKKLKEIEVIERPPSPPPIELPPGIRIAPKKDQ